MPARPLVWLGAFGAGVALALAVPEGPVPGLRAAALGLSFLGGGLAGEAVLNRRERAPGRPPGPTGERARVAPVAGVVRQANPTDPRFGRYVRSAPRPEVDAPPRDAGSRSPPLRGRVVLYSVYLGSGGRAWKGAEIAGSHKALAYAAAWVEREAERWGAWVNLRLADTYFRAEADDPEAVELEFRPEGDRMGPFERNGTFKLMRQLTAAAPPLGFRDLGDWFDRMGGRVEAEETVWLIHPRRGGRSFAIPREESDLPGVSLAVCYAREESFPSPLLGPPRTDPATVAHEVLHLFGATDKYGRKLAAYPPGTVTTREIMRMSEPRLSRLQVDARTAGELGWLPTP